MAQRCIKTLRESAHFRKKQELAGQCLCMQMWWSLFIPVATSNILRQAILLALARQISGQRDKASQPTLDSVEGRNKRWAGRVVSMRVGEVTCPACRENTFYLQPFAYSKSCLQSQSWVGVEPIVRPAPTACQHLLHSRWCHRSLRKAQLTGMDN